MPGRGPLPLYGRRPYSKHKMEVLIMRKFSTKDLTLAAMVAALYAVMG